MLEFILKQFSFDWFSENFTNLDRTLRHSQSQKIFIVLFLKRFLLVWLLVAIVIDFLISAPSVSLTLGLLSALYFEMLYQRNYFDNKVLPQHKKNTEESKKLFEYVKGDRKLLPNDIAHAIEIISKRSSWGIAHFTYALIAPFSWEALLKVLYPIFTNNKEINYEDLSLPEKSLYRNYEQALWELANSPNDENVVSKFFSGFGNVTLGLDLSKPTLFEQKDNLEPILESYRGSKSPMQEFNERFEQKQQLLDDALPNTGFTTKALRKVVKRYEINKTIKEDITFYILSQNYFLRDLLFYLSNRLGLDKNLLFQRDWNELERLSGK